MDIFKGTFPGLLILLGLFCFADAQTCTTIANCSQCTGTTCLSCNDGYSQNEANTGCCSKGCPTDENSYHLCNVNTALCSYEGCLSGYYGPYCLPCTSKIQNCDNCGVVQGTTDTVECITCATGFFETTDNQHCCPMGCDSCTGASGTICTTCKASYFLYNQKCDTCGNNCVEPTDGAARCDPVTGRCILGCKDGWHGSKCDVQCTLSRCDRCTYDEPTASLTCADCNSGYYGSFCVACSATCASVANGDLCNHEGTCTTGCLPGYRGNKCDITCDSANGLQNCLECDRYPFTCTKCKAGFWGPQCQNNCHANCVEFQGSRSCTINNGTCDFGCLATHYKMDCSGSCPNCGNDVCERETGVCLDPICDAGYWGRNCNSSCPAHCRPQTLQGVATCNFQNGNCTTGCTDGNWGEFCNEGCSVNCALSPQATEKGPLCSQSDGTCVHQCKAGSYRLDCSETCQSECVTGACDITDGICVECRAENPGYLCPEGTCTTGFRGLNCSVPCESNFCQANTCERYSGKCVGCLTGRFGDLCTELCDTCRGGSTCQQFDGKCDDGCAPGKYGSYCKQSCDNCITCAQTSGLCTECPVGKFSDLCSVNCSSMCVTQNGIVSCDLQTGACDSGMCLPGFYGVDCFRICNDKCKANPNTNIMSCDINSGACDHDCIPRFYGPTCNIGCDSFCHDLSCDREDGVCAECYKENPNYNCPDAACVDGKYGQHCNLSCSSGCTRLCDRYTAQCSKCKDGLWGPKCTQKCPSGSGCAICDQTSGDCISCIDGKHGTDCDLDCGFCTPSSNGLVKCEKDNAACLTPSCVPGYHGRTCEHSCNPGCADSSNGVDICEFETGTCSCDVGFYSFYCDRECSITCLNKHCSGSATDCVLGCAFGYYGSDCLTPCPENCVGGGCDGQTGACDDTCKTGFFNDTCTTPCDSTCIDFECDKKRGDCLECQKSINTGRPSYYCRDAACDVGKHGTFCNAVCPGNCLSACGRYNGTCFGCTQGYHGPACNLACGQCNSGTCDQKTGLCSTECNPGYWNLYCNDTCLHDGCNTCFQGNGQCATCDTGLSGTNCDESCSEFCARNIFGEIICEKGTGSCDEGACLPGYWNRPCDAQCNGNCLANSNGARTCSFLAGDCDLGCEPTYYGGHCTLRCSETCIDRLCARDGTCTNGCVDGAYGDMCEFSCKDTCNNDECDRVLGICEECSKSVEVQTPLCRTAACSPVNTWGVFCEYTCPVNCADGTCSREDGTCSSCKAGKHGDRCDQDCPNCATNACDQDSGICLDSCKDGWYQLDCMSKCKHEGCQTCERNDGECVTCKAGTYGQNCSMVCARTCALGTNGQITCNRFTGQCDMNACRSGYYTPTCTEECSAFCQSGSCDLEAGTCSPCINGWYGQKCDGQCSTRCKNKDCETTEASCRQGCTDGYWGSSCEKVCNVNCAGKACNKETAQCLYGCNGSNFYGLTCLEPCNVNCIDKVCNRTGYCQRECVTGWYGDKCQYQCTEVSKCTDGKCSRLGGICEDCLEENPGSNCPSAECPSGKRGQQCEDDCTSSNCLYNQCGRYTDKCNGCPSGLYGDKCELTCSNCRTGTGCDQATGECNVGCKDGWFEPDCETKCDTKCGSCDRLTGECITCAVASWGPDCGRLCSSNCVETHVSGNHFVLCDKNTGHCEEQACKVGHWREDCTQNCSINCLPDENNNRVCAYLNGECARGCKKTFFGRTCGFLCSTRCRDQLCTNFADTCDLGCTDGYYGATCASVCSSHCAGDGGCNPSTGACYDGCEKGYYGTRCIDPCKNTCVDGFCDATEGGCADCRIDPVGPNCRIQLCDPGLYGPTCESKCPGNYCLNNQCKRTSGDCNTGCLNGYYGAYCAGVCQCDAEGTVECEQTKGECICKVGSRGTLCDLPCSSGCDDLACERDGTCSNGCISGRYGARCEDPCSNCMNQACNAANGVCLQGCIEGWYGTQCNMPCGSECKACDVQTGLCTSCANDFYSLPQCDRTCSSNCKIQGTGRQCNQATGDCMYGCVTGYYSLKCSESCGRCGQCDPADGSCPVCNAGWWGTTCKNQCSPYCARGGSSNERMCRQSDGFCEFGCDAGYYGDSCASQCIGQNCLNGGCHRQIGTCTSGCQPYFYDTNCDQRCNTCKNGLCNQVNGYCTEDCPANSYGNKCDKECLTPLCVDATCERYSGYCADCQTSPKGPNCAVQDPVTPAALVAAEELTMGSIIGITVGSVAFVIIFVVVFVCCMNYKRRYDDAKSETRFPPEFIEPLPSHRSLQGTASTIYPVARVVDDSEKDFVLF